MRGKKAQATSLSVTIAKELGFFSIVSASPCLLFYTSSFSPFSLFPLIYFSLGIYFKDFPLLCSPPFSSALYFYLSLSFSSIFYLYILLLIMY
jgi:hypothetical protein